VTRDEAMLKLLDVEPARRGEIVLATGWPAAETCAVLDRLVHERRITYAHRGGSRWYATGAPSRRSAGGAACRS
jgi:hypothetical protein